MEGIAKCEVRLKGINSFTTRLADGTVKTYWYAWKSGPRIDAEPGTPEFVHLGAASSRLRVQP